MYLAPDDDSTVAAYYVKMISKEIDPSIPVDTIDIGVRSREAANATMLKALQQDSELLESVYDKGPILELVIKEKEITKKDKKDILKKLSSCKGNILALYDIYVAVKDQDGNELGRITQLPEDVEFAIVLPNSMRLKESRYCILGNNDGYKSIDSELSDNGRVVYFKTNLMSQYALVKTTPCKPNPDNPDNPDNPENPDDPQNPDYPGTGDDMWITSFTGCIALLSWIFFVQFDNVIPNGKKS